MRKLPPNPVVLVHGLFRSAPSMNRLRDRLRQCGREGWTVNLQPNDGSAPLEQLALQLSSFIASSFPNDQTIDVIGFSMGGIVSRYYVQRLAGGRRIDRLITISAPHHGSWLAHLSNKPGCIQMRPASSLLSSLNENLDELRGVHFTSVWTPFDLMVLPARSSCMDLGKNTRVWSVAHALMILEPRCLRLVTDLLA